MGLEIVAFNVQNFEDRNGVIENLGVDNVEQIRKKARGVKEDVELKTEDLQEVVAKYKAMYKAERARAKNDGKQVLPLFPESIEKANTVVLT